MIGTVVTRWQHRELLVIPMKETRQKFRTIMFAPIVFFFQHPLFLKNVTVNIPSKWRKESEPNDGLSIRTIINQRTTENEKKKKKNMMDEIKKLQKENDRLSASQETLKCNVKQISDLSAENELLKKEIQSMQKQLLHSKLKMQKLLNEPLSDGSRGKHEGFPPLKKVIDQGTLIETIGKALLAIMSVLMAFTKPVNRLRVFTKSLFDYCIFGADVTAIVLRGLARTYARTEVYVPWKILKAMDLAPKRCLNYHGIEVLREVEGLDRYEQGMLPSRLSVQKVARKMYDVGQEIIPIIPVDCPLGEMYKFDYKRKLRLILKSFGLHDAAQTSNVEISITLDGTELCDFHRHVTAGVKVTDRRAVDPLTKRPLCSNIGMSSNTSLLILLINTLNSIIILLMFHHFHILLLDNILRATFNCQSSNNCFIFMSMIGKDSKEAYTYFKDFFEFFETAQREGLPAGQYEPRLMPMLVWSPQDLSSIWKRLGTGGGAKKKLPPILLSPLPVLF